MRENAVDSARATAEMAKWNNLSIPCFQGGIKVRLEAQWQHAVPQQDPQEWKARTWFRRIAINPDTGTISDTKICETFDIPVVWATIVTLGGFSHAFVFFQSYIVCEELLDCSPFPVTYIFMREITQIGQAYSDANAVAQAAITIVPYPPCP